MMRCPLCIGFNLESVALSYYRCKLCALVFLQGAPALRSIDAYRVPGGRFVFPSWKTPLAALAGRPSLDGAHTYYFCSRTVPMLAARFGLRAAWVRTRLRFGVRPSGGDSRAQVIASLVPWPAVAPLPDRRLTLGVIAALGSEPDVSELCTHAARVARDFVVVLDGDKCAADRLSDQLRAVLPHANGRQVRVVAHPLQADFAAQRNRVQQMAATEWVLHLDSDERMADGMSSCLPALLDDAERLGWDAVGFTRRNVVDGIDSALYPDPQGRLIRCGVRFTRPVHEYPDVRSPRRRHVHLGPGLVHYIAGQRLHSREEVYERIMRGAGRPDDTALLSQPLEAAASVFP